MSLICSLWQGLGDFTGMLFLDNVEAVTIKPDPKKYTDIETINTKLKEYMDNRCINYSLHLEEGGQYHYHGIISYENWKQYTNLRRWLNNNIGHIHISPKNNERLCGWYKYCIKNQGRK